MMEPFSVIALFSAHAMKMPIQIFIVLVLVVSTCAFAQPIQVLYLERPPYYYTVNGRAVGFLVEKTRRLFEFADIPIRFTEMPPKRIIRLIKKKNSRYCSIGWFKNPQRETFAKFSLPIYQNQPIVILTTRKQAGLFSTYSSLKEVFADRSVVLGVISEFSYGIYIDRLIKEMSPSRIEITSKQALLPGLITNQRISFMLIAPEEVDTLLLASGHNPNNFVSITMSDIPAGNLRYLMFSQNVRDKTIDRINTAIRQEKKEPRLP